MTSIDYWRQREFFNPDDKFNQTPITIIGAGGIGSFTCLSLAKLGLENITIYDGDKVEAHNIPNQFYKVKDIGRYKTTALKRIIKEFTDIKITGINKMWTPLDGLRGCVISAVDNIETRAELIGKLELNPQVELFVDGRIGGEICQIFTLTPLNLGDIEKYKKELVEPTEELPCTARAIIDVGFMMGSLIARAVRDWIVNKKYHYILIYYANDGILYNSTLAEVTQGI